MGGGIIFDWTINIGHILTFLGFVVGGLGVIFVLKKDVQVLAIRITAMETAIGKLSDSYSELVKVMTTLARQEERISGVDRRVEDMRALLTSNVVIPRMAPQDH